MKITLVASSTGWHSDQLVAEAKKKGIELEIVNIENINDIKSELKKFGDVVFWRSASISPSIDRTTLLGALKDKPIINHAIYTQPFLSYKLYQQKTIQSKTTVNGIPTFKFGNRDEVIRAVESGVLKYPFIQKPNLGSKGENVVLIKDKEQFLSQSKDIKIKDQVYQNFIRNNGDYRVLMLGGRVLGVMKRTAVEGSFLNNVSKGGIAQKIVDEDIIAAVTPIARTVAATLDLTYCGVDIIKDEDTGEYHFLEVNTAPQWKGFQGQFPEINVAEEIIDLCISFAQRQEKPTSELVREYYDKNYNFLAGKQFHFASRMWLWTKDKKYRKALDELKERYIGKTEEEIEEKIKHDLAHEESNFKHAAKKEREEFFNKYPRLSQYNPILFYHLFCRTLYDTDIRPAIRKFVSDEEFLEQVELLKKDDNDFFMLSSRAVNFLYLLDFYFDGEKGFLEPERYLNIAKNISFKEDQKVNAQLKTYILTHAILGATRFYSEKAADQVYQEMLAELERVISNDYFSISLDNKLEFLVCAKLCDYESYLRNIILDEASKSQSNTGNFIVDKLNEKAKLANYQFPMSEHRNVLYLMASMEKTQ